MQYEPNSWLRPVASHLFYVGDAPEVGVGCFGSDTVYPYWPWGRGICPFDTLIILPDGVKFSTQDYSQDWLFTAVPSMLLDDSQQALWCPHPPPPPTPWLDYSLIPDIHQMRRSGGRFITFQGMSHLDVQWMSRGTRAASTSFWKTQKHIFHPQFQCFFFFKPVTFQARSDVSLTYSSHRTETPTPTRQRRGV